MLYDPLASERQQHRARLFELDQAVQDTRPGPERQPLYRELLTILAWMEEHPDNLEQTIREMSWEASFEEQRRPLLLYGKTIATPGKGYYLCADPKCLFGASSLRVAVYHALEHPVQSIDEFLLRYGLTGQPQECSQESPLFHAASHRCYTLKLERRAYATYASLYTYTDQTIQHLSINEMLPRLVAISERYRRVSVEEWGTQEWVMPFVKVLGEQGSILAYALCENTYWGFLSILGEEGYQALVEVCKR